MRGCASSVLPMRIGVTARDKLATRLRSARTEREFAFHGTTKPIIRCQRVMENSQRPSDDLARAVARPALRSVRKRLERYTFANSLQARQFRLMKNGVRVEPVVTHRLPHRSVRAQLRHTVPRMRTRRLPPSVSVFINRASEH